MKSTLNPWGEGGEGGVSSSTDLTNSGSEVNNKVKNSSIQTVVSAYGKLRNILEVSTIVFGMESGGEENIDLHPNEFVQKLRKADEKLREQRKSAYESKMRDIMAESNECLSEPNLQRLKAAIESYRDMKSTNKAAILMNDIKFE